MTRRIPQRDVNLAYKLLDMANVSTVVAQGLLNPVMTALTDDWHKQIENHAFDLLAATREHGRKINVVEKKGQRA